MTSPTQFHVFLSAVSSEFRNERAQLENWLERKGLHVSSQEKFNQGDSTLWNKLHDEVARSQAVICVIGAEPGWPSGGELPQGAPERSWTQWEFSIPGAPQDVRTWLVWESLSPHVSAVTSYADRQGIADPTSYLMNNLGVLLLSKASYEDAEPLMRRTLAIVLRFTRSTGHAHPHLQSVFQNYASLLEAMGLNREQIVERLFDLGYESGFDEPTYRDLLSQLLT